MKLRIQNLTVVFLIAVILLSGCSGCEQKIALKGSPPAKDYNEQSKYGLVSADERKPIELPPMIEPSFDAVIEQFKADVAANLGEPEVLARKKRAIADPDILWDYNFVVPNLYYVGINESKGNPHRPDEIMIRASEHKHEGESLYFETGDSAGIKHKFLGEVFYLTEDQEKRIKALKNLDPPLTGGELQRRRHEIAVEGLNPLTVAKYFQYRHRRGNVEESMAIEYAERALEIYPSSAEVMLVWANCQPLDRRIWAYKELVTKFPNFAKAHETLGKLYYYNEPRDYEAAIQHFQKAVQLDSRIKGDYLGKCYYKLGDLEKTITFYQSLSEIDEFSGSVLMNAQQAYVKEDESRRQQVMNRFIKDNNLEKFFKSERQ